MKSTWNLFAFLHQSAEGLDGIGRLFYDQFDVVLAKVLSKWLRDSHIAGLALADYKNHRIRIDNILYIFNFNSVAVFAPPVRDKFTVNDFDIIVADLSINDKPAERKL